MITKWLFRRPWLPGSFRTLGWLLLVAVAAVYLNGFPGGFRPFEPALTWLFDRTWLLVGLCVILAVAFVVFDKLDWQGTVKLDGGAGHGWALSIRSRLGLLINVPFFLVIALGLFDFAQRAWFAAEWGRFAVAAFFCLDFILLMMDSLRMAASKRRVLAIESGGVRFGEDLLPFSAVERVRVRGDLKTREVALVSEGRERWLDLSVIGVSGRTFVERLLSMAPDLQVEWPVRGEGEA